MFIDGEIKHKSNYSTGVPKNNFPIYIGGGDNGVSSCKFNDVRFYDEALSTKQIKEISQAKICHYTFNEELYENTTNLYSNYPTLGGTGEYENSEFKAEKTKIEDGYYRYK